MKIKTGFITNSSSTAYIIYIPKSFHIVNAMDQVKNDPKNYYYNEELGEQFDDDELKFLEAITKNIAELESGESLWGDETLAFNTTQEILEKSKCVIASVDISSDSGGMLIPVDKKALEEIQEMESET